MNYLTVKNPLIPAYGSFWSDVFEDQNQLRGLATATLVAGQQTEIDALQMQAGLSRKLITGNKRLAWKPFRVYRSEIEPVPESKYLYGGGSAYGQRNKYGDTGTPSTWKVRIPGEITNIRYILSSPVKPKRVLVHGVDFYVTSGHIVFNQNPFVLDFLPGEKIEDSNGEYLNWWMHEITVFVDSVYTQHGYVLSDPGDNSSLGYKPTVNARIDTLITGSTAYTLRHLVSGLSNIPVATSDSQVEAVIEDVNRSQVVTTDRVYNLKGKTKPRVLPGEVVTAGDFLGTGIELYSSPDAARKDPRVTSITLHPGDTLAPIRGPVTFDRVPVALTAVSSFPGKINLSSPLGGSPQDAQAFWDYVNDQSTGNVNTVVNHLARGEYSVQQLPDKIVPLDLLLDYLPSSTTVLAVNPDIWSPTIHDLEMIRSYTPGCYNLVIATLDEA